ncbi:uncharacterized protein BDZ99DRAFT_478275 [Mytilinidion resinicola]|uniref:Uncharacterized protein n=1 Tax=Mytilinidion resinicola TaxID=574789 RepID=A0A6A6YIH7_9PEZI|nr:uncharacterized protein BDZ99DRAFT_478275 [Mytilinidion resinicola]KAF2807727.1 hypothetical protein BDZ99DRAFT_478275 [Mytilinidion resinicola]
MSGGGEGGDGEHTGRRGLFEPVGRVDRHAEALAGSGAWRSMGGAFWWIWLSSRDLENGLRGREDRLCEGQRTCVKSIVAPARSRPSAVARPGCSSTMRPSARRCPRSPPPRCVATLWFVRLQRPIGAIFHQSSTALCLRTSALQHQRSAATAQAPLKQRDRPCEPTGAPFAAREAGAARPISTAGPAASRRMRSSPQKGLRPRLHLLVVRVVPVVPVPSKAAVGPDTRVREAGRCASLHRSRNTRPSAHTAIREGPARARCAEKLRERRRHDLRIPPQPASLVLNDAAAHALPLVRVLRGLLAAHSIVRLRMNSLYWP